MPKKNAHMKATLCRSQIVTQPQWQVVCAPVCALWEEGAFPKVQRSDCEYCDA